MVTATTDRRVLLHPIGFIRAAGWRPLHIYRKIIRNNYLITLTIFLMARYQGVINN